MYGVFEAHCHGTSFLQVRLVPTCLFLCLRFSQLVSRHPHARYITSLCGHPSLTQPPSPSLQGTLMHVTLRACVVILLSPSHPPHPYKASSCALHYELVWSSFSHPVTLPFPTRHPPSLQGTLMRVTLRACVVILLSPSHPALPYKASSCALHYELVWSSFSHPATLPFPTRHPPSLQGILMRVTLRACVVILFSPSHPPLPYKAPSCALHYELVWSSFSHPATLPFPTRHPHARYITSLCGHPSLTQPPSPSLQGTLHPYKAPSCALHYELVWSSFSHPATLPFPTRHPHVRYITSLCGQPSHNCLAVTP